MTKTEVLVFAIAALAHKLLQTGERADGELLAKCALRLQDQDEEIARARELRGYVQHGSAPHAPPARRRAKSRKP